MKISHVNMRCASAYSSATQSPWRRTGSGPLGTYHKAGLGLKGFGADREPSLVENQIVATIDCNQRPRLSPDSLQSPAGMSTA